MCIPVEVLIKPHPKYLTAQEYGRGSPWRRTSNSLSTLVFLPLKHTQMNFWGLNKSSTFVPSPPLPIRPSSKGGRSLLSEAHYQSKILSHFQIPETAICGHIVGHGTSHHYTPKIRWRIVEIPMGSRAMVPPPAYNHTPPRYNTYLIGNYKAMQ